MTAQERADEAAEELVKAVAEMGGPKDGEAVVIVRFTQDASVVAGTTASGDLFWHWDWFKRLKTDKGTP